MISYSIEHEIAQRLSLQSYSKMDEAASQELRLLAHEYERWQKAYPLLDTLLSLVPLFFIIGIWILSFSALSVLFTTHPVFAVLLASAIHGFFSYSWVIYSLHECAGHGPRKWSQCRSTPDRVRFFLGATCRLFMSDPEHYREFHFTHHSRLGTDQDGSFTHAVQTSRLIRSLLPFSGILYPNDYKVHMGTEKTASQKLSLRLGLVFALILTAIYSYLFTIGAAVLIGLVLGPWISFILDRLRESIEHQLMPVDRTYGVREIGWTILGHVLSGGPWGQPFHFTHHFAQSLPWYLQIRLALSVRKKLKLLDARHPVLPAHSIQLLKKFIQQQQAIYQMEKGAQDVTNA